MLKTLLKRIKHNICLKKFKGKKDFTFVEPNLTGKDKYEPRSPVGHKWTDIIDNIVWDQVFANLDEHARLVGSGLYSESEFKELCDFTGKFSCDYKGRFQWCKLHWVIEKRGRSEASRWFYDSPVDHVIIVYGPDTINIKGYKYNESDGKFHHVKEEHLRLNSWDEFKSQILDPWHLLDNDPFFFGRRDDVNGYNWLASGSGYIFGEDSKKWVLEDEPLN